MDARMLPTAQLLKTSEFLFQRATSELQPEQWFEAPDGVNPMIWLAGHLTLARHTLLQTCGVDVERPWEEIFGRYSKILPPDGYPPASEVLEKWNGVTQRIGERLAGLKTEELQVQLPSELPLKDKSRLSLITFLAYHEGYHVGQMATIRKWLGLGGLIDG